jgi:phosphate transport system substrate-binding protein
MLLRQVQKLAFLTSLGITQTSSAADDKRLVLTGASTIAPLALELGKRFEKQNPGLRVDVQSGGSGRGIADARSGVAAIGLVSRALKPEESDLIGAIIAYDGVCVILHRSNPVATLSDAQIKAIYTGQISNWKDVGGVDKTITVVNKAEGRSTLELFAGYFGLKNSDIKPHVVIGDNQQGVKTVAGNPGAIGYVSIGTAEYEAAQKTPIKLMPLNGVAATSANVQAGKFPLARPLLLVTKTKPEGLVKRFIDFAQAPSSMDLVKGQFFVPLAH